MSDVLFICRGETSFLLTGSCEKEWKSYSFSFLSGKKKANLTMMLTCCSREEPSIPECMAYYWSGNYLRRERERSLKLFFLFILTVKRRVFRCRYSIWGSYLPAAQMHHPSCAFLFLKFQRCCWATDSPSTPWLARQTFVHSWLMPRDWDSKEDYLTLPEKTCTTTDCIQECFMIEVWRGWYFFLSSWDVFLDHKFLMCLLSCSTVCKSLDASHPANYW